MDIDFAEYKKDVLKLMKRLSSKANEFIHKEISNIEEITTSEFLKKCVPILFEALAHESYQNDASTLLKQLMFVDPKHVLEAFIGTHSLNQKTVKIPTNLNELRSMIREAAMGRQKIKAVSTKNSCLWNNIGVSNGTVIDTSSLKATLNIECMKETLSDKEKYRHFEAGIMMREIQENLWPSKSRTTISPEKYRVFRHATAGAALSLAGTVSTGAHGNGFKTGIVADAVVSFQMFVIDREWRVKRYQIEPKSGITDADKFKKKHQMDDDNFELIQDDKIFDASVVNIGCMGVVYSYVLVTEPGSYLTEKRDVYTMKEAKSKIKDLYKNKENFQIIANPYKYSTRRDKPEEYHVLISVLTAAQPLNICHRPAGNTQVPIELLDEALVSAGGSSPHVIPLVMHFSLLYLEHEKVVINAVEALNTLSGIVDEDFNDVQTSECAIRLDSVDTIFKVISCLHELYETIRSENPRQLVNVPTALRFTASSKKYMAMGYDGQLKRPTLTIEQSIINGTLGADNTLKRFRDEMRIHFFARPHWGMLHDMDANKLGELYKDTKEEFCLKLNLFDPNFVFENEFADWVFGKERRKCKEKEKNEKSTNGNGSSQKDGIENKTSKAKTSNQSFTTSTTVPSF